jgi:hypothetical protein
MSLEQHYGIPHFTGIYKDYELAHSIRLTTGENPEIQIQKIWTILEHLWANGCVLPNYLLLGSGSRMMDSGLWR